MFPAVVEPERVGVEARTLRFNWPILVESQGSDLNTDSLWFNDRWDINNRWSVNLGARYDKNDSANSVGATVADDSIISPRVGATSTRSATAASVSTVLTVCTPAVSRRPLRPQLPGRQPGDLRQRLRWTGHHRPDPGRGHAPHLGLVRRAGRLRQGAVHPDHDPGRSDPDP